MSQADELRAGINGAREVLKVAIKASEAHGNWETPKGTTDDGEAGWSPRQVAEHVIPSELFFANGICAACGYDGPDNPLGQEPKFASPSDALAALEQAAAAFDSKIKHVQDEELGKSAGGEGMAAMPAGALMAGAAWHIADHAAQIMNPFA